MQRFDAGGLRARRHQVRQAPVLQQSPPFQEVAPPAAPLVPCRALRLVSGSAHCPQNLDFSQVVSRPFWRGLPWTCRDRDIERLSAEREQAKADLAHARDKQARRSEERAQALMAQIAELDSQCGPACCAPAPAYACWAGRLRVVSAAPVQRCVQRSEVSRLSPVNGRSCMTGAIQHLFESVERSSQALNRRA